MNELISPKMLDALNEQIKQELQSFYLYLSMAAYFHDRNLDGMAQWMRLQANEELTHAMRLFDHVQERGGRVKLLALGEPRMEWESSAEVFEEAYKHEQFITSRINSLVELAEHEDDKPAAIMLQWFINEQVEEEASTSKVAQMLIQVGNSGSGLLMLDHQLGKRES